MENFIAQYFVDADGGENTFYPPATEAEISALESQLQVQLPQDYKDFLRYTNGFDGCIKEFYASIDPAGQVYQSTQDTCADFFSGMICIGSNGGGEMLVIDTRQTPYQFGLLPHISAIEDFLPLGDTFQKLILRLYDDTAFDRSIPL